MKPNLLNVCRLNRILTLPIICALLQLLVFLVNGQEGDPAAPSPSGSGSESGDVDDDEFLSKYEELAKKAACEGMQQAEDPKGVRLNLERDMSYWDITVLTFLHKGRNLAKNPLNFPEDIKWKHDIVKDMFTIFMQSCDNTYVRHDYLNIMRQLIMIYLNSVEPRGTNSSDVWAAIGETLKTCSKADDRKPYKFLTSAYKINRLLIPGALKLGEQPPKDGDDNDNDDEDGPSGGGKKNGGVGQWVPLREQIEIANTFQLDLIIDNFWHVFSHAWATCLPKVEARELWGPRFKQLFYRDFLEPLEDRWKGFDDLSEEISIIVGDMDISWMQINLPLCTEAAYLINNLDELQLVRPIRLTEIERGVSQFQNKKLNTPVVIID